MVELKRILKSMLVKTLETCLYRLNVFHFDAVVKYPEQFGGLGVLQAYPSKRVNLHIMQAYRITSQRQSLEMVKGIGALNCQMEDNLKRTDCMHNGQLS